MLICTASSPTVHPTAQTHTEWQLKTDLPSTPRRDLSLQRVKSGYKQRNSSTCKSSLSVPVPPSPSWLNRLEGIQLVLPHISGCSHAFLVSQLCKLSEMCVQSASQRTPDCYRDYFYQCYHRQCIKVIKFPQQRFKVKGRKRT